MENQKVKAYMVRGVSVVTGIFMVGIAVGFFKIVAMGADPFTAMNTGISSSIGMQFIGFGTIFNMVFVGYTADFLIWILTKWRITFGAWPIRVFVLAAAVLLICIGDALYISADMGMSPYDAAGYMVEILTKGKLQFRMARIILDMLCVIIGFIAGMQTGIQWEIVGIGTVISAFGTGPLIQFFRVHWSDKLLLPFQKRRSQ